MSETPAGAVIVISSHVVRGSVGNRAAVFALETLGYPVWALPTVILPWHPGHGPATRITIPEAEFDAVIDDLIRAPWIGEVKAVLSGYLGGPGQAAAVARLVQALREKKPDLFYACDPVIGDVSGLYVPEATAIAIRDHLLPLASLATPNRFELSWLCGADLDSNAAILEAALSLGPPRMLVTSAIPMISGSTGNLYLSGNHALLAEHRLIDNTPNGTGDLLSALFLARLLEGLNEERALQLATAGVFEVIARSRKRGADELTLEQDASSLSTPMAMVQMRRLLHPSQKKNR
ncbi:MULTISPECIES: pyridoxal kinase PdxY [unclassified Rhizobium]|uniref:pyridoxal kinase PdxY n=1 Tax=unclassified Rhizobium TaxID=2613769 RepID=UPI0006F2775F|nr:MULTISPECIES: pyridoxal kinase PdxY [unclassified Rhizobium]KQV35805.1 pyridoxamine kinase [Rhizobium sp. Root1212]KRD25912.1 pyridoxamine kinase [Rhizobium sp. Root268]